RPISPGRSQRESLPPKDRGDTRLNSPGGLRLLEQGQGGQYGVRNSCLPGANYSRDEMMNVLLLLLPLLLVPLLIGSVVALLVYILSHAKPAAVLLQEWAWQHGYRIVAMERRLFDRGPFFWSGRHATVYYVTLENGSGRVNAYVRCTPQLGGWPANPVEVRW